VNRQVAFAVPGALDTPTGGYVYDRRIICELRRLGFSVEVIDLGDCFPHASPAQRAAALEKLGRVPQHWAIVIDGLALGVLPEVDTLAADHGLVGLVHHPLALETGISAHETERFLASERAALNNVHLVVVTSAATARLLCADYGVPADRVAVVAPGVDKDQARLAAVPSPPAQLAGVSSEQAVLSMLAVGAVVPRKGYGVLIAALAIIRELPWRLSIVGDRRRDSAEAARLDADILHHGLTERVVVEGTVSAQRLAGLYEGADLFVLASRFEGYGMAFADAIAYGLPVVGTTAGAIPETVPAGAGVLVRPDDADALATALRGLIIDREKRLRFAAEARRAAALLPSWPAAAASFAQVLDRLP
jgi:glycosyltransferase involved in cell wall biosynthesis